MSHRRRSLLELDGAQRKCAPAGTSKATNLFQRQRAVSPRPNRPTIAAAKSYDNGAPIRVQKTASRRSPGVLPRVNTWSANAALSDYPGDGVSPYRVESFEVSPTSLSGVNTSPARGLRAAAQAWTGRSLRAKFIAPASSASAELADSLGYEDAAFDADLQLIAAQIGQPMPSPSATAPQPPPVPESSPSPLPAADPYAIFDQMGHSLQYANTFNLGSIELDRRFKTFEHELDQEEAKRVAAQAAILLQPLELDDVDLVSELALISEAPLAVRQQQDSTQSEATQEVAQPDRSISECDMARLSTESDS